MEIGEQDRTLLRLLQTNGRMSNQELAERANMSTSACWRRVRALEAAGAIQGYVARLDPAVCGFTFQAIVHVQLARHDPNFVKTFVEAIMGREEVLACFATTGEADYYLHVICQDQAAYNAFLDYFLFRVEGVASVRTNLVLKEVKNTKAIPV